LVGLQGQKRRSALDQEVGESIMVPMYDDYVGDGFLPEPELAIRWWSGIFSSE